MPSYNIVTDFGATGGGTTNDAPAFGSFNSAAAGAGSQVILTIPNGIYSFQNQAALHCFSGIKNLLVIGGGMTTTILRNDIDQAYFLGGNGLSGAPGNSARVMTVAAGASSVTLKTVSDAAKFTVGLYVVVSGLDLQGIWMGGFGVPQNWHFFERKKVIAIDAVAGVVTFDSPLKYYYSAAWPNYDDGRNGGVDQGGPASIFALDATWDTDIEYRDIEFNNFQNATFANGRNILFTRCRWPDPFGLQPSQNDIVTFDACDQSTNTMEVDKLIGKLVMKNGNIIHQIDFQSSSVEEWDLDASTVVHQVTGTPKKTVITRGSDVTGFQIGASSYGASVGPFIASDSTFHDFAVRSNGSAGYGGNFNQSYAISGNIVTASVGATVSSAVDDGSGGARLVVDNTASILSGKDYFFSSNPPARRYDGFLTMTVVDATHIDVKNVDGTSIPFTGAATGAIGGAQPWAVPGAFATFSLPNGTMTPYNKIVDVSLVGNFVQITFAATVPTNATGLTLHPAASVTVTKCVGCDDIVSLSAAPPGLPLYSWQRRTYTGVIGLTAQTPFVLWGYPKTFTFDVPHSYAGAGALAFHLSQFDNYPVELADGSLATYAAVIDMKQGNRTVVVTPATNSDGVDSGIVLPAGGPWFYRNSNSGPQFWPTDISGIDPSVSIAVTLQTDQGVGSPAGPTTAMRIRLH